MGILCDQVVYLVPFACLPDVIEIDELSFGHDLDELELVDERSAQLSPRVNAMRAYPKSVQATHVFGL